MYFKNDPELFITIFTYDRLLCNNMMISIFKLSDYAEQLSVTAGGGSQGCRNMSGHGDWSPQILAEKVTLIQSGGQIIPTIQTCPHPSSIDSQSVKLLFILHSNKKNEWQPILTLKPRLSSPSIDFLTVSCQIIRQFICFVL